MELQDLIKHVAQCNWTGLDLIYAESLSSEEVRQLSVAVMQRASQFSPIEAEAKACPLNSETAAKVRQNAFLFAVEMCTKPFTTASTPRWQVRLAEYARRFEESKIEGRLSFGNHEEVIKNFANFGAEEYDAVKEPRKTAEKYLALAASQPNIDRSTRMLLGYEQAYWLQLDGKFFEANEMFSKHAKDCYENGDTLGGAIFVMQSAKAALDGKFENSAMALLETYERVLPELQEHREHPLAKQWMEKTMTAHVDQAASLLAAPIKGKISLALEGRLTTPEMGGM